MYCQIYLILCVFLVGAGRVTFSSRVSFMSAVSCRFLQVTYGDIDKKVHVHFMLPVCRLINLILAMRIHNDKLIVWLVKEF